MPNPRQRRLMRRQIGAEVLSLKGLSNVASTDILNTTNIKNLQDLALYSRFGISPAFAQGSTDRLTDAASDADGVWTLTELTGETTKAQTPNTNLFNTSSMSGSIGLFTNSKHYMIPPPLGVSDPGYVGVVNLSSSATTGPFILYSSDGPSAKSSTYYIGSDGARSGIDFGREATGSGTPTHLVVFIAGQMVSDEAINIVNISTGNPFSSRTSANDFATLVASSTTCSAGELNVDNTYRKAFIIPTSSLTGGFRIYHYAPTTVTTTTSRGFFITISSGSYP